MFKRLKNIFVLSTFTILAIGISSIFAALDSQKKSSLSNAAIPKPQQPINTKKTSASTKTDLIKVDKEKKISSDEQKSSTSKISKQLRSAHESDDEKRPKQREEVGQEVRRSGQLQAPEQDTWWLRAQKAANFKLETTNWYQSESKQQARKEKIDAREEKITTLKKQLKNPLSREEKKALEKELETTRAQRSVEERMKRKSIAQGITKASETLESKMTKHESVLRYGVGGGAVALGGAAVVGSLAVGMGGTAYARSQATKSLESEPPTGQEQSGGETFEVVPFSHAPPPE